MNPYQESAPPSKPTTNTKIDWFAIFQAGVIYFVASFICAVIFSKAVVSITTLADLLFFILLTVLPWMIGAFYLAWNIKPRWQAHGLLYSLITPLALFINVASTSGVLYLPLWISMLFWQLGSTAVAMITIYVTRVARTVA